MKIFLPALLFSAIVFTGCKSASAPDDLAQLEKNVRAYFFLGDSTTVKVTVKDTLRVEELNEMILAVSNNYDLIQQDIDTLQLMVDDWSYKALDLEKTNPGPEANDAKIKSLEYRVKLGELELQRESFVQTNRILNRLKRSIWADIAGFDAIAEFTTNGQAETKELLLDANYNVVD